jgi:hypothetical protein
MHSKGKVSMYKPGSRPAEDGKVSAAQKEDSKDKSTDDEDFVLTKAK